MPQGTDEGKINDGFQEIISALPDGKDKSRAEMVWGKIYLFFTIMK